MIVVFGFFFATVSSRMVIVECNPVSGMAIAALIVTAFYLKAAGNTGQQVWYQQFSIGTVSVSA